MAANEFDASELGPAVGEAFARDGVICIRGLLSPAWVDHLRVAVDDAIARPGPGAKTAAGSRFIVENCLWQHHPRFRTFAEEGPVARAAAIAMSSARTRMFNDTIFVKEPAAPEPTPWHHDLPYFKLGGSQNCSVWIALDTVTQASGAMHFALGSHRWGKMFRPVGFGGNGSAPVSREAFDGTVPDIDADPERYPTISFDLAPGDVTFHHLLTVHKAGANTTSATRRRAHTIRMAGDDAIYLDRPFATADFGDGLRDGDPLSGPFFPILWPRPAETEQAA